MKITQLNIKDPASAITHFIGFIAALTALPFIVIHYTNAGAGKAATASVLIFMVSMMMLYGASAMYHCFAPSGRAAIALKRNDHLSIFLLIAGSYTPYCVNAISQPAGNRLLIAVWTFAAVGMIVKFVWILCPKWFSSVIYIMMGWLCVFALPQMYRGLSMEAFIWLAAGGVLYSIGGVIYALRSEAFNARHPNFGNHEVFHLFVLAGSVCHFISIWQIF